MQESIGCGNLCGIARATKLNGPIEMGFADIAKRRGITRPCACEAGGRGVVIPVESDKEIIILEWGK